MEDGEKVVEVIFENNGNIVGETSWYGKKDVIFKNSGNIVREEFQVKENQEVVPAIEQLIKKKRAVLFGSVSELYSDMNMDNGIFSMTVDAVRKREESGGFPRWAKKRGL